MSRKLLAFLLSELQTVRVICKKCEVVTEMTADKASGKFQSGRCPVCEEWFYNPGSTGFNPLFELLKMIQETKRITTFDVEFTLPDSGEPRQVPTAPK